MNQILEVRRGDGSMSKVAIGNVIGELEKFLPEGARVIVVTDRNVMRYYGDLLSRYECIEIGLGEEHKTLDTLAHIYARLLAAGADRKTYLLGFGGGIVTDVAGFAASTYMRGLQFGFVASTLLAQVDASVGGKNGVNFEGYKNMVGTFNQPDFVLCDTALLKTLPEREFRAGLAEIIKAGLIADQELFELFERHDFDRFRGDEALLTEAIVRAVRVKKTIVDRDEKETGDRKKLNLGHTFAHAVEKSTRDFIHGEAVAIGACMIADISAGLGLLTPEDNRRIRSVLERMELPTASGVGLPALLEALKSDKKKDADSVDLILPNGIGDCLIRKYSFDEIERLADTYIQH